MVVVVAAVVSAFVVVVVVVVVEAELFSDDVAAFPEQAEIPVITIMPLKIAASILFFIDTFLSLTAVFFDMLMLSATQNAKSGKPRDKPK